MASLSLARAEALLLDLLGGYSTRTFQKRIDAAGSQSAASLQQIWHLEGARKQIASVVQREVLPQYGFDDDEEGVAQVERAIRPYREDPKIARLLEAIAAKLRLLVQAPRVHESADGEGAGEGAGAGEAPPGRAVPELCKAEAVRLFSELFQSYSDPGFQARLRSLTRDAPAGAREGRRRLLREAQASVLPRFGFEASDEGVAAMTRAAACWEAEPEVHVLARGIEELLAVALHSALAERAGRAAVGRRPLAR